MSGPLFRVRLLELHRRVLENDPHAADEVARTVIPLVVSRLAYRVSRGESEDIAQAANDAVVWYLRHPGRFNPTRARLDVFLSCVAYRRVQRLRWVRRRAGDREVGVDTSALARLADARASSSSLTGQSLTRLFSVAQTAVERCFLDAAASGGSREEIAAILGLEGMSKREQDRRVHAVIQRFRYRAKIRQRQDKTRQDKTENPDGLGVEAGGWTISFDLSSCEGNRSLDGVFPATLGPPAEQNLSQGPDRGRCVH